MSVSNILFCSHELSSWSSFEFCSDVLSGQEQLASEKEEEEKEEEDLPGINQSSCSRVCAWRGPVPKGAASSSNECSSSS